MVNYDFLEGLEAKRREAEHKEVIETPLNAKDIFFFYPLYLENRLKAQKLFKIYASYKKNQANIIKEIFDMEQLLESRILNTNIDVILSDDLSQKVDRKYIIAFEDLVRRLSQYREKTGKELFNNTEDMREYVSYLTGTVKFTPNDYNTVLKFMDKNQKHRSR
jgi:hypothetical protein